MKNLKRKNNTFWAGLGGITHQGLRFISTICISRIISAEELGTFAIAQTLLSGLLLLTDLGTNISIIQNKDGKNEQFLNTAWSIQLMRGVLICILSLLISFPLASFYDNNQLAYLVPAIGATALIDGLCSTSIPILYKSERAKSVIAIEVGSQVIATCVALSIAFLTKSVWALPIGAISFSICKTSLSYILHPSHKGHSFRIERKHARTIISFGKWIFASALFAYLSNNSDRLMIGKLINLESLGYYAIAATIATFPYFTFSKINNTVFLPLLSKHADASATSTTLYNSIKSTLLPQTTIVLLLIFIWSDIIIDLIYPPEYKGASMAMKAIAICTWLSISESVSGIFFFSKGQPKLTATGSLTKTALLLTTMPLLAHQWGLAGALLSIIISESTKYTYSLIISKIKFGTKITTDLTYLAFFTATAITILYIQQNANAESHDYMIPTSTTLLLVILWAKFGAKKLLQFEDKIHNETK